MNRVYYWLIQRDPSTHSWHVQFGDYERSCVHAEYRDYFEHGTPLGDLRIVKGEDTQSWIDNHTKTLTYH